jgi:cation transport protein ChaC
MSEHWVFGYGSLIWKPGFQYEHAEPGELHGLQRRLCVHSYVHRGTPEQPGLVLGLDKGGSCSGMCFRVAPEVWPETLRYLREREQVTLVYREEIHPVTLQSGKTVHAVTYVVDRMHEQYAGTLDRETILHTVLKCEGQSGHNKDYVISTAQSLEKLGVHDATLHWLSERLTEGFR